MARVVSTVLYRAGRQSLKVRAIMIASLAAALVTQYAALHLLQTYGTSPGDGGVLAPLWQRAIWAIVVSALGLGFAAGMILYGRQYVDALELLDDNRLRLTTLSWWGGRVAILLEPSALQATALHRGVLRLPKAPSVRAPWMSVRVPGRRLPFVLDMQGQIADADAIARVLKTRESVTRKDYL
jgi:hypothetical protein